MITSRKPNKNSPVLQHTLTVLPSRSNALRISLEHATLRVSSAEIAEISRRMLCSSYSRVWGFVLYNLPFKLPHKYKSQVTSFTWNLSSWKLAPKVSATFPSRLLFKILYTKHTSC